MSRPIGGYPDVDLPDAFGTSTPWRRASDQDVHVSPINRVEWMVRVGDGDLHRVAFALDDGHMIGECDCLGHHHNDNWCAHVAAMVRLYVRGRVDPADVSVPLEEENARLWRQYRKGEA